MSYTVEGSMPEGNNPLYDEIDTRTVTQFADDWSKLSDPWSGWADKEMQGGGGAGGGPNGDIDGESKDDVSAPLNSSYRDQIDANVAQLKSQLASSTLDDNAPRRRMSFVIAQKRAEAAEREHRAFTAWANAWLAKRDMRAVEMGADFADGVLLINLIEIAFETEIGRYNMRPKSPMQKLDNVSLCFKFMESNGMRLLSTDFHDIVAKKEKQITNVLSTLLRHLVLKGIQMEMGGALGGPQSSNVKANMLAWLNKQFPLLKILDLWTSFRDGLAFCAIVDKLIPGKIDVQSLNSMNGQSNLKLAFTTAEQYLGIPAILQPEDFLQEKGDDQAVMNYLAMLLSAAKASKDDREREEEMNKLKNDLQEKEKVIEREIIAKQKQLDEISSKLTAALEEANSSSSALSKASENERKWRDATEKWRDSSRKWRESAEKWRASDEKKTAQLKSIQSIHQQEMQQLNSEIYRMHRELEEMGDKLRETASKSASERPHVSPTSISQTRHQRSKSRDMALAIQSSKSDEDLVNSMPIRSGVLWRRRPNATFNKTRFKKVYFVLNGANLDYLREEGGKLKGSFILTDYHIVVPLPTDRRTREDGKDLIMRMNSNKSESANLTIEFKGTDEEGAKHKNGVDGLTLEWTDAINTRISLLHYMKIKETRKGTGWGCSELVQFITDSKTKELMVMNHPLGMREPMLALRPALLAQRNRMTSIVINNCELDDSCAEVVAEILRHSQTLQTIDLTGNKITAIGAGFLADGLAANKSLTTLVLDHNQLKDEGLIRLSSAVQVHHNLSDLSLVGNSIGDNGVVALCHALEVSGQTRNQCHSFPEFHLSINVIGDAGLIALSALVAVNPTIKVLHLDNNVIGDAGVVALASSIEQTDGQVAEVNLSNNQISSKGVAALGHAFRVLQNEVTVDISENRLVSRAGIAALVDARVKLDYILLKLYKGKGAEKADTSSSSAGGGPTSPRSKDDDDAEQVAKVIAVAKTQMSSRRTSSLYGGKGMNLLSNNQAAITEKLNKVAAASSSLSKATGGSRTFDNDSDDDSKPVNIVDAHAAAEKAEWEAELEAAHTRPRTSTTVPLPRASVTDRSQPLPSVPLPLPPVPNKRPSHQLVAAVTGQTSPRNINVSTSGSSSPQSLSPTNSSKTRPFAPPPALPARPAPARPNNVSTHQAPLPRPPTISTNSPSSNQGNSSDEDASPKIHQSPRASVGGGGGGSNRYGAAAEKGEGWALKK